MATLRELYEKHEDLFRRIEASPETARRELAPVVAEPGFRDVMRPLAATGWLSPVVLDVLELESK